MTTFNQLKFWPLTFCIILFLQFFQCGLFSPDDPEDPEGKKDTDPLDFRLILKGNVEQFNFEDYNELFYETFIYVDPNNNQHSRTRLLSRLSTIEAKYTGESAQDTLDVSWYHADTTSSDPEWFDKEKEITLQPRAYHVLLGDSLPSDTSFTGEATFKLRYSNLREEWAISYWRDVPTDGAKISFFHPDFSQ